MLESRVAVPIATPTAGVIDPRITIVATILEFCVGFEARYIFYDIYGSGDDIGEVKDGNPTTLHCG